ncbi:MAG: phosphoribosylformylglycinamidine synthase subunit PurS [candidate division WOR-3 bacterium]|jgi:phosphoribosylformylglycinamidine synthase PurS subunit
MKEFKVKVLVLLKENLFDPQGKVLEDIMKEKNIDVKDVRVGKLIVFSIRANNKEEVLKIINEKLSNLFANPVIEMFEVDIVENEHITSY